MRLRQLEYLRLVLEKGSYAAAAQAAGVSQPSISQSMQALERELGQVLFEKAGRKKVPTPAALAIARRALDVDNTLAAMRHAAAVAKATASDPDSSGLRVGLSPTSALLYGATIERVWRAAAPDGVLQFVSAGAPEMLAAITSDEVDLVICPRPRGYPLAGVRRRSMYTSTPAVYCRKGHPLQHAASLAGIAGAAWAVTGQPGTPGNVIEEAHRVRAIPVPRVLVHCADYPTLLRLVAQTDLLCVIPHPALVQAYGQERVARIAIAEGLPHYEVSAFWKPASRRHRSSHLQDVIEALLPVAEMDPGLAQGSPVGG